MIKFNTYITGNMIKIHKQTSKLTQNIEMYQLYKISGQPKHDFQVNSNFQVFVFLRK